ncbi:hypothetical protein [Fortiea contorta]|uniref:hypothetical protein n=1 Tax=Fortiea contorta TaxID=1892405 RepID=UPI000344A06F|nr:hypothetical protein [Fortiea contorta]
MQNYSTSQSASNHSQVSSTSVNINGAIALLIFIIPISLCFGVKAYRKYRAAVLRQQIATLEKLWRLESKKKKA